MKRLIINALAVCLLAIISLGAYSQSKDEMKLVVAKMNQEMIDLVKAGRYEAMGKYYDEAVVSLPNYRAMEIGYKLILSNNLGRLRGGYKVVDGKKTTSELFVGEDMMVDIGSYTLTVTFPGLAEPKVDNGKYLNVWRKDKEGTWRIIAETWNADKSPNAPAQSGKQQAQPSIAPGNPSGTQAPAQKPAMESKEVKK